MLATAGTGVSYLAKLLDSVRSKGDEARPSGAGLHPLHPIIGGGVTPQQVHQHHPPVFHGQRALQVVYLLYSHDGPPNACTQAKLDYCMGLLLGLLTTQGSLQVDFLPYLHDEPTNGGPHVHMYVEEERKKTCDLDPSKSEEATATHASHNEHRTVSQQHCACARSELTSMHAEDSLFNGGSQGQPVEETVEALPGPKALLLSQPLSALQPKPKQCVDVSRLRNTLYKLRPRNYCWPRSNMGCGLLFHGM